MQFSTIFVSAAALFISASASPVARETHISDFRLFGEPGCSAQNEGVWTVLNTDLDKCTGFNGEVVKSVTLTDINKGCKFWVYSDAKCSKGKTRALTGECTNAGNEWKSWKMKC
ncbi:hypothetical protein B0T10DRAFT_91196 [Thelonectria olida]|uniref:Uncharacterized protein n=1 Tax=Thelonectria olida TaxID=1576542 RepID=A0A9P8W1R2_9HYPO|nr:hypothetical protein B0T10DRAFT_91196 [Thelonectria olida]